MPLKRLGPCCFLSILALVAFLKKLVSPCHTFLQIYFESFAIKQKKTVLVSLFFAPRTVQWTVALDNEF